jgi:hypothetical protein
MSSGTSRAAEEGDDEPALEGYERYVFRGVPPDTRLTCIEQTLLTIFLVLGRK